MLIRNIEATDDAALAQLIRSILKNRGLDVPGTAYFDPELDHLSAYYAASPQRAYFVAEQNGELIGGAGCAPLAGVPYVAEVQKLYVAPAARRQGVATQLMDAVEDFARNAGFLHTYLETHHALPEALTLYQKRGYTQMEAPYPGSPHTTMDYFFTKEL